MFCVEVLKSEAGSAWSDIPKIFKKKDNAVKYAREKVSEILKTYRRDYGTKFNYYKREKDFHWMMNPDDDVYDTEVNIYEVDPED